MCVSVNVSVLLCLNLWASCWVWLWSRASEYMRIFPFVSVIIHMYKWMCECVCINLLSIWCVSECVTMLIQISEVWTYLCEWMCAYIWAGMFERVNICTWTYEYVSVMIFECWGVCLWVFKCEWPCTWILVFMWVSLP